MLEKLKADLAQIRFTNQQANVFTSPQDTTNSTENLDPRRICCSNQGSISPQRDKNQDLGFGGTHQSLYNSSTKAMAFSMRNLSILDSQKKNPHDHHQWDQTIASPH